MNRRGKNKCVEFAMDSTTGGEHRRRSKVPSTRIITALIRTRCMYTLLYGVGRSPTRDLQLEQLHRGESLTSFDRETGPVSIARKLREIYEWRIRRRNFTSLFIMLSNLYFVPRFIFLTLSPHFLDVRHLCNYRFAKDFSCEYFSHCIILYIHVISTLMIFFRFLVIICDLIFIF